MCPLAGHSCNQPSRTMMSHPSRSALPRFVTSAALLCAVPSVLAADCVDDRAVRMSQEAATYRFRSVSDSVSWNRNRALAANSRGFRIVVSLQDCHLWVIIGRDTVMSAPAAVAKGTTLEFGKSKWTFDTPRGMRTVLAKESDPVWRPPRWLYAETASEHGLLLRDLSAARPVKL